MKTITILIASLATNFIFAQEAVTVHLSEIPNDKGTVVVGLYTEASFMKAKPEFGERSKIENGAATVIFENVPAGEYAVAVYQDENENTKLDFGPRGIPAEAIGSSNNAPNPFGPPLWDTSKFTVSDEPVSLDIKMTSM